MKNYIVKITSYFGFILNRLAVKNQLRLIFYSEVGQKVRRAIGGLQCKCWAKVTTNRLANSYIEKW